MTHDGLRKAHDDLKRVEQERAELPQEERQRLEAADAPLLRIQLLHMLERARKAERAADLLADSHRRAEKAEDAVERARDLHQHNEDASYCDLCSNHGDITWPCATVRALDGGKEAP